MKQIITAFTFTKIIILSQGMDNFAFDRKKVIDSTGTIELTKKVRMINDSTAIQRKYNKVYYYVKTTK